jgi:very-short-patch-repair endonuclease
MTIPALNPRQALNKAFLKVKPNRTEIEGFKANLIQLLDRINDIESEEFHKNLVSDFLKKTYYEPNYFINTKGRNDLVIHNGNNANSTVGVIIEAKKPTNRAEMIKPFAANDSQQQRVAKLNVKAFQELVLYYLRERFTHRNLEVKHLVATNINEWFIFDVILFDRLFAQNKDLVKQFNDFEGGRLADTKTDFFYKQIAEPFINAITSEITFTYFNIQEYQKPLRNSEKEDDILLISLFKLVSPEHLLKLPFTNDSNSLDKRFYSELLHIIGLTETKDGSKKLITRNKEGERNSGSMLEDAIIQLESLDKISRLENPSQFGNTTQERLFNIALELCITWINRILFLKLLEGQLIKYHKNDKKYAFLNHDFLKEYDDLNSLFFQVLAKKHEERNEDVKEQFSKVPYLNSSLFEPTELEHNTLFISNLKDTKTISIFSQSVLKDQHGKRRTGNITTLHYLFDFLEAYDFGAEGGEEIQEDNKTIINASVLGLIFEKINGYKDGSFFTPGFITMYMCRETIRKAVIQKFNEAAMQSPLERGSRGVSNTAVTPRRQIIPYNPKLKEFATELRNNSTKSEVILWGKLKGKFDGKYDFHRQKPLDNYIADFFCYELKLVIEIDGLTHNWEETYKKDYIKECKLNELGLNVLRFPDSYIFDQMERTLNIIALYIEGFEKSDLSEMVFEESVLNPLSKNLPVYNTPLNPLSRGDFKRGPKVHDEIGKGRLFSREQANDNPLSRGDFESLKDIYEEIGKGRLFTREKANEIVNSVKICDPAVGSGHFLVSALNEMIAIKNDLEILQDRQGNRLKE